MRSFKKGRRKEREFWPPLLSFFWCKQFWSNWRLEGHLWPIELKHGEPVGTYCALIWMVGLLKRFSKLQILWTQCSSILGGVSHLFSSYFKFIACSCCWIFYNHWRLKFGNCKQILIIMDVCLLDYQVPWFLPFIFRGSSC